MNWQRGVRSQRLGTWYRLEDRISIAKPASFIYVAQSAVQELVYKDISNTSPVLTLLDTSLSFLDCTQLFVARTFHFPLPLSSQTD